MRVGVGKKIITDSVARKSSYAVLGVHALPSFLARKESKSSEGGSLDSMKDAAVDPVVKAMSAHS